MKKILLLIFTSFTVISLYSLDDDYFIQHIEDGYSTDFSIFKGYRVVADNQKLGAVEEFFESFEYEDSMTLTSAISPDLDKIILEVELSSWEGEGLYAIFEYYVNVDNSDRIITITSIDAYALFDGEREWEEEHAAAGDSDFIEGCQFTATIRKEIISGQYYY